MVQEIIKKKLITETMAAQRADVNRIIKDAGRILSSMIRKSMLMQSGI